jgi:hypothetical protein
MVTINQMYVSLEITEEDFEHAEKEWEPLPLDPKGRAGRRRRYRPATRYGSRIPAIR